MSALGEKTLILLLTDTESLDVLAREGLNVMTVPTVEFREIVVYAQVFHRESGVAPSISILHDRFSADVFSKWGIDLTEDVEEPMVWAIKDLKATWIQNQTGQFTRKMATTIGSAPPEDQPRVLSELSAELSAISLAIAPRTNHIDLRDSGPDVMAEYEYAASNEGVRGMRLGLPALDEHIQGIWPGELFVMAGPPGSGKSFFSIWAAYKEWERGRCTSLFTLENSIMMTQMRIACCALHLDIELMQSGQLPESEVQRLREWCQDVLVASDTPLHIINPEMVQRSPQALVQMARSFDTESMVADQLTHFASVNPEMSKPRHEEVAEIVRTLADAISSGPQHHQVPCLLLHQIKRAGVDAASKTGRLVMTDLAESAEVERSASGAMSLFQSEENLKIDLMEIQGLKFRRVRNRDFYVNWEPWKGIVFDRPMANQFDETPAPERVGVS